MHWGQTEKIETEVFARLPDNLRRSDGGNEFVRVQSLGAHATMHSGLEGPSFDRDGNLYCVDTPWGRIFRVDPQGNFEVVAEYDGWPNGLKIDRDGRILVADYKLGIVEIDPSSGKVTSVVGKYKLEGFKGCNDLVIARNGDIYFTDQGQTGLHDPTGRVFRLCKDRTLELLLDNVPSPNGIALSPDETRIYLAVTRDNAIWRVPLLGRGVTKVGAFIRLSGGLAGPDGMAIDEAGGLAVAHAGLGVVWLFDEIGRPTAMVESCEGLMVTNVAYGGADMRDLYITELANGCILKARVPVPGRPMTSHLD